MRVIAVILLLVPWVALGCGGFFYVAPPTLDSYPERLPAKTLRELLREDSRTPAKQATFAELQAEVRALVKDVLQLPPAEGRARLAALRERNRQGEYRKRFANALNDFEDLLAAGAAGDAGATTYLGARLEAMDWDDGFIHRRLPDDAIVYGGKTELERQEEWDADYGQRSGQYATEARQASPRLRPHWLILQGAWEFRFGKFGPAAAIFETVRHDFPQHARAEVAQLMIIRARIELWRETKAAREAARGDQEALARREYEAQEAVQGAFVAYSTAYPEGRFTPDLPGWRGGFLRESGDLRGALGEFLRQLDPDGHPEVARRAVKEVETCLEAVDFHEEERGEEPERLLSLLPLEEIARRPAAALAVVYHFLDAAARQKFVAYADQEDDTESLSKLAPMLRLRRAGRVVLPALAATLGRQGAAEGRWRPRELAVLAWAATELGEHRSAARLCEIAGPVLATSDDLRFVQAVAWQRAGELKLARRGYESLSANFPHSSLRSEAEFRLLAVLRDLHEQGAALTALLRWPRAEPPAELPDPFLPVDPAAAAKIPVVPSLHLDSEIEQWQGTLLQFAPLPELEKSWQALQATPELAATVALVLRFRYLAAEDFAAARRFAPPVTDAPPKDDPKDLANPPLQGEEWAVAVRKLETLTALARTGEPAERAAAAFATAEAWAGARGRLILTDARGERDPESGPDWRTRAARNAVVAGFSAAGAGRELAGCDELQHAVPHYLAAARLQPSAPFAPMALHRANAALQLLAGHSPWQAAQAFELNDEALSRSCYERLRQNYPQAPESGSANVWWSFAPAAESGRPKSGRDYEVEAQVLEALRPQTADELNQSLTAYLQARKDLEGVAAHAAETDAATLRKEVEDIRSHYPPHSWTDESARLLNHLDDFLLFLQQPNVTPAAQAAYLRWRLQGEPPAPTGSGLQAWPDFVAFLELIREETGADETTVRPRVRSITERMNDFLQRFPQSPKREAALARRAIGAVREAHGHAGLRELPRPVAPALPGDSFGWVSVPAKISAAASALADYEREFPTGRYAADVRFWRAVSALDSSQWEPALSGLTAVLDNDQQRDLHLDAALNLAAVFMRLLEQPGERPALLAALRRQPAAQVYLWKFMHSPTPGARLLFLQGYVREALARTP